MKCQKYGYTCITAGDGHLCCQGREPETRDCVPCDETLLRKPANAKYVNPGTCVACLPGELPLKDTMKCQKDGYTCILAGDGYQCCAGREPETRECVPCDQTMQKKPRGTKYVTAGTCDYERAYYRP